MNNVLKVNKIQALSNETDWNNTRQITRILSIINTKVLSYKGTLGIFLSGKYIANVRRKSLCFQESAFHWCFTCECNTTRASLINGLSDSVDISYEGKFWWSGIANLLSIKIKNYIYITHTSKQFSHFLSLLKQYILIIYINTIEYLCKTF